MSTSGPCPKISATSPLHGPLAVTLTHTTGVQPSPVQTRFAVRGQLLLLLLTTMLFSSITLRDVGFQ